MQTLKKTASVSIVIALLLSMLLIAVPMNASAAGATTLSDYGLELIKKFEGFSKTAYWDYSQWTIGYGNYCGSNSSAPDDTVELSDGTVINIKNGISEADATLLLEDKMQTYVDAVKNFATKHKQSYTQNQFDAIVSFTYNMGTGWMSKTSYSIYKYLSTGTYTENEISDTFTSWCNAGGSKVQNLYNRRQTEVSLFLTPDSTLYEIWQVTSELNHRASASTSSTSYGTIATSTYIVVTDTKTAGGYTWGKTRYYNGTNSNVGWSALTYAKKQFGTLVAPTTTTTTTKPTTTVTTKPTTATTTTAPTTVTDTGTVTSTTVTEPTSETTTVEPTTTIPTTTKPLIYPFEGNELMGDVNNDKSVNVKDVLVMRKKLAGYDIPQMSLEEAGEQSGNIVITEHSDINNDGTINVKDVLMLRKHLAGWKVGY